MGILVKNKDQDFFQQLEMGLKYKNIELIQQCQTAIKAFIKQPVTKFKKQIQAVAVSTDLPITIKEAFNVTIRSDNFDMGYEQAFRAITLGDNEDSWEIHDVSNSLTFEKVEEGQRIEVAGVSGTRVFGYVDYYGGALGWTDKFLRFRKIAAMIQMAEIFRNKFWKNKADNHYSLLAAAAALTLIPYQGVANDGQVRRDIMTINLGAFNLGNTNKDKGYGDMANAPFILYANPYDEDRIEAAFRAVTNSILTAGVGANVTGIGQQVTARRITRVYTFNPFIVSGFPILILPGQKIQKADAMQPTLYTQEMDILTLNKVIAYWAIYGAVIGDTEQCLTLTLG